MSKQKSKKIIPQSRQGASAYRTKIRWTLVFYDALVYCAVAYIFLWLFRGVTFDIGLTSNMIQTVAVAGFIFICRAIAKVYTVIWRYGGAQAYMRLIIADLCAGILFLVFNLVMPIWMPDYEIQSLHALCLIAFTLLVTLITRFTYQWLCMRAGRISGTGAATRKFLRFLGADIEVDEEYAVFSGQGRGVPRSETDWLANGSDIDATNRIKVAIVGAGRMGVALAEELTNNPQSFYKPACFIDNSPQKSGRTLMGLPVLSMQGITRDELDLYDVQEIVLALPQKTTEQQNALYMQFKRTGLKVKNYDYPIVDMSRNGAASANATSGKRVVRDVSVEELLFRKPVDLHLEKIAHYFENKVVLVTGGGGSIGSEICRQVSQMHPKQLIILDVFENGAYDIQQELVMKYGALLNLSVEILSVVDKSALRRVYETYHPQIVLHAAAHKHVPLMEHNVCEAIWNNVFGTRNNVELADEFGVERFTLISTDKAVNPTNVMGATKRMCEMIVQQHGATSQNTIFTAVRFGNVLGSSGSVVPLFKRQILAGGPITLTDARIVRYFMTIPEATALVLQSSCMAQPGQLFVLDMGKPVRIADLAVSMIELMGYSHDEIKIIETGLRPGEKLYEELLVSGKNVTKTENKLIFTETTNPLSSHDLQRKLLLLQAAVDEGDPCNAKASLKLAVPTYKTPDEVNQDAKSSSEMQAANRNVSAKHMQQFVGGELEREISANRGAELKVEHRVQGGMAPQGKVLIATHDSGDMGAAPALNPNAAAFKHQYVPEEAPVGFGQGQGGIIDFEELGLLKTRPIR